MQGLLLGKLGASDRETHLQLPSDKSLQVPIFDDCVQKGKDSMSMVEWNTTE